MSWSRLYQGITLLLLYCVCTMVHFTLLHVLQLPNRTLTKRRFRTSFVKSNCTFAPVSLTDPTWTVWFLRPAYLWSWHADDQQKPNSEWRPDESPLTDSEKPVLHVHADMSDVGSPTVCVLAFAPGTTIGSLCAACTQRRIMWAGRCALANFA